MGAKRVPPELLLPVRRKMLERAFARLADQVLEDVMRREAEANEQAAGEGDGTEGPGSVR